jgi:hypothetical protein
MSEIGYSLLMILMGCAMVWHFWDADIEKNIYDVHGVEGRYGGYTIIIAGLIFTTIEILDILPDFWVALIAQVTGIMLCIAAVALAKWQYDMNKKMHITPHLTVQERRKDYSQYVYIGLSFLFIIGLIIFILNLG